MNKNISTFDNFILTEDLINRSSFWPDDWKNTPQWKLMEILGFIDTTTPQQQKNGTIKINGVLLGPTYPAGLVLQRSGYIRNPLARSGFVRKMDSEFSLTQMFDYILKRFLSENMKGFNYKNDRKILDQFFLENPLLISVLDKNPELQQEIITRTGMKDFRSIQSLLKKPIW